MNPQEAREREEGCVKTVPEIEEWVAEELARENSLRESLPPDAFRSVGTGECLGAIETLENLQEFLGVVSPEDS